MRDWLVETRHKRGESQYKTAADIGIAQSTYASFETGARRPSVAVAKKIGAALGVDWTRFYEDTPAEGGERKEG